MQIIEGIYLPDGDRHYGEQIKKNPLIDGKGTYQYEKLRRALEIAPERRGTAIDVGANVGLWTRLLAKEFGLVIAVEPIQEYITCLMENINHKRTNVQIWQFPLSSKIQNIKLKKENGVATAHVCVGEEEGDLEITASTLDIHNVRDVDFIKIDCEGFEYFVIEGAERTIRKYKPVVIVEQKKKRIDRYGLDRQQPAVKLLESWGMKEKWFNAGDHCLGW